MSSTSTAALSASTASFLTSLATNGAIAGTEFVLFIIFRRIIKAVYEPRTYIPPKNEQATPLGTHLLWPLWAIIRANPEDVLEKNGVDPYVFIRFLRMMSKALVPIWLISWTILLPIDSANSEVLGKTGLDKFTFGNVASDKQDRYWAHLILTYMFNAWILYLIWGEMKHWLNVRLRHLVSPRHSRLAQANTVLVTGIPKKFMDEEKLAQLFAHLPGGVKRIWLNRNLKEMPDLWQRRLNACGKLESAQVQLVKAAHSLVVERAKQTAKLVRKGRPVPEKLTCIANPDLLKESEGEPIQPETLSLADRLVPRKKRATNRLKPSWSPIGLGWMGIGKKVDTIEWARQEIAECTEGLEKGRKQLAVDINTPGIGDEKYPPLSSAFIHFNQQIAAHMARQCLTYNRPYKMNQRFIEQSPANVIWRNMSLNAYEANVRQLISYAITLGLIILWSIPVAFIGTLSNITTLTETFSWLSWINGASFGKKLLQGAISGLLPPVLLALLMQLLPFVLRQLASFQGIVSKTEVELDLMTRYFIFLVIHTFFIVTLSSGLVSSIKPIAENPASVATILAQQLPTASTFFITLILTQFTGTMGTLLQPVTLVLYYVRVILGGGTPRSVFRSRYRMPVFNWGTTFPGVTVYCVIMIAYMIISPIINGFGAAFFVLSYLIYKYHFIWVHNQPEQTDTGGSFFPKAITHVFVGMYIQEVSALPQAILMIILIVCTAAYHYVLSVSYGPLLSSLPLSLAHLSYGMPQEEGHEGSVLGSEDGGEPRMSMSNEPLNPIPEDGLSEPPSPITVASIRPLALQAPNYPPASLAPETFAEKEFVPRDFAGVPLSPPDMDNTSSTPATHASSGDVELGEMGKLRDDSVRASSINQPNNDTSINDEITDDNDESSRYFAVPGGPGVLRGPRDDANDEMAFFHPATKDAQRIVWIPQDELGIAAQEIEMNISAGVQSTAKYAIFHNGKVRISGPPPDLL